MKFHIFIEYKVENVNEKELNEDIDFEYHKRVYKENGEKKIQIYSDTVKFRKNKIEIKCKRTTAIDLNNCWKTKKATLKGV